ARTSGYFDPATDEKPLLHTWSLGVEEQYYIIFPLFIVVLWRFGIKRLAIATAIIAVLSFAFAEWGWRNYPVINFYFTPTRAWELLLGSLLAYAHFNKPLYERVSPVLSDVLSATGLLLIAGAILFYDQTTPFPSVYALVPTAGAAMVLGFARKESWSGRLLSLPWLVGIGLMSYSAYLWHFPLFAFAKIRSQVDLSTLVTWLIIGATFLFAYVSWKYVETPFRQRSASRASVFTVAGAFSVMFMIVGMLGSVNNGFPSRLTKDQLVAYQRIIESNSGGPNFGTCQFQVEKVEASLAKKFDACAKTNPPALVLIGDSHGYDLFNATIYNAKRPFVVSISRGACRPYPIRPECHYRDALEFISARHEKIDTVIFTQSGRYYLTERPTTTVNEEAITKTQEYLTQLSKSVNVIWLGPKSEPNVDLLNMNVLFSEFSKRDKYLEKQVIYSLDDLLTERNADKPFRYLSLVKIVQYDFDKDFYVDGKYTYSDTDHWSTWGEQYFGARLLRNETLYALLRP
ncbi:MAG TPA: acyltransferase family protein, partial [Burkholderiales bacterium]|nr:acyltransferase family protein [Burkholderiales bacterium]